MKILAVVGLQTPYIEQLEKILSNAGMASAVILHQNELISFVEWHGLLIKELGFDFRYAKGHGPYHNQLTRKLNEVHSANNDASLWGWVDHQSVWTLDVWLDNNPNFHALLPCYGPERWLASRLDDHGLNLLASESLDQWIAVHQQLLRVHFRYPERTLLVDGYDCLTSPESLFNYLTEKWQLPLESEGAQALDLPTLDPLAHFLAKQMSQTNAEVWSLQQTIEASLQVFAPDTLRGTLGDLNLLEVAIQGYRDIKLGISRLEADCEDHVRLAAQRQRQMVTLTEQYESETAAKAEALARLGQLEQAWQELTAARDALAQQNAELSQARDAEAKVKVEVLAQLETVSRNNKQLQTNCESAQVENGLLLEQLHLVQEELETVFHKTQEADKKITKLQTERDDLARLAGERQRQNDTLKEQCERETAAKMEALSQRDAESKAKAETQARLAKLEQLHQELTATRDALTQEKVALTQARDVEAKARVEALAQRNAEVKAKAEALARIGKLEQAHKELIAAHDALVQQNTALSQTRDAEAKAKDEALSQVEAQARMAKDLRDQANAVTIERDTLQQRMAELVKRLSIATHAETELSKEKERAFALETELKSSHEENALLLEQLHLVQEELESLFLKTQDSGQNVGELTAERDRLAELVMEKQDLIDKLTKGRDDLSNLSKNRKAQIEAREKLISELRERVKVLEVERKGLQVENKTFQKQLQLMQEKLEQTDVDRLEKLAKSRRIQINERDKVIKDLKEQCKKLIKELDAQTKLVMTLGEGLVNPSLTPEPTEIV